MESKELVLLSVREELKHGRKPEASFRMTLVAESLHCDMVDKGLGHGIPNVAKT